MKGATMNLKNISLISCFLLTFLITIPAISKVILNETDFKDRVYACWLGKNIGGTLGMPFEGKKEVNNVTFYTKLKPGEPAANDDLDLQMLWLKAMEENAARVEAFTLGDYWLKFVPVDWNEYGVGKANMRMGIMPPLSGEYNNLKWKNSNGAWIRSEIWACLAPGLPLLAAQMAREDACVDHGAAEGTFAELFTASIESAAFIEPERDRLIAFGLSMIPENCRVARAVHVAIAAKEAGKDWLAARADVLAETEDMGWFQAPANVAYVIIGWLYGDDDFGKSICIAVNCGDDTDCTGATLGSIFGIIGGTKAIPNKWREPIGNAIKTVAVSGFPAPETLEILTDNTLAMTKKVLAMHNAPVEIRDAKTDVSDSKRLLSVDKAALRALWAISPYQIVKTGKDIKIIMEYSGEPLIQPGVSRAINIIVKNQSPALKSVNLNLLGLPEGWKLKGVPTGPVELKGNESMTLALSFTAPELKSDVNKMQLMVAVAPESYTLPLTLIKPKAD